MGDRPAKFGAEDLRQLAWRNSYLKSKDEQEFHANHPIPRVSKFGIKRDSMTKTTLPPLIEEHIPSVARHGIFNNEPMPPKNTWYKRRASLPSSITYKHQYQRNPIEFNYPSIQHFSPQGKKPIQMLPIATNMMAGCLPQQQRRATFPVVLTVRNNEHNNSATTTSSTTENNHIELQKDNSLLNKRKKSNHIIPK